MPQDAISLSETTIQGMLDTIGKADGLSLPYSCLYDAIHCNGDDIVDALQGIYWAYKNRFLFEKPALNWSNLNCPVICCGSGPTLTEHIETIRANQDRVFIIAADSTTDVLANHGIAADMVTPVERIDVRKNLMAAAEANGCYAGMPVVPYAPHRFNKHLCIGGSHTYADWIGLNPKYALPCFPLSGAQSVNNGFFLTIRTKQPVYLVGMDLVEIDGMDHAGSTAKAKEATSDFPCVMVCNDGQKRRATMEWFRTANMIGTLIKEQDHIMTCSRQGVKFSATKYVDLPKVFDPGDKTTALEYGPSLPGYDKQRLLDLAKRLPSDLTIAKKRMQTASETTDLNATKLVDGENSAFVSAVFTSVYLSLGIFRRHDRKHCGDTVSWFKTIWKNVMEEAWPFIEDIAKEAGA